MCGKIRKVLNEILAPAICFYFLCGYLQVETDMIADFDTSNLKKGDIIQFQRKGFFICDKTGDTKRLVLVSVALFALILICCLK